MAEGTAQYGGFAVHRERLYYPYLHVRDESWPEAAPLSFSQVGWMVPLEIGDEPIDSQKFKAFYETRIDSKPFLTCLLRREYR